jgi:hypothetical protein
MADRISKSAGARNRAGRILARANEVIEWLRYCRAAYVAFWLN